MLRRTFLPLPGVGVQRERELWSRGIDDWARFRSRASVPGMGPERKRIADRLLAALEGAYGGRDWARLARVIPRSEHWRFYPDLALRCGFVDIETTGRTRYSPVTVVGILDGGSGRFRQLVRERDLDPETLAEALSGFEMLVTFNGASFDLPILDAHFPGAVPRVPHMDLRPTLGKLGYKGGLKRIEKVLGLGRPRDVDGMDGYQAVLLWERYYTTSDQEALDLLLAYNREDVVNMKPLAERAVGDLVERIVPRASARCEAPLDAAAEPPPRLPATGPLPEG